MERTLSPLAAKVSQMISNGMPIPLDILAKYAEEEGWIVTQQQMQSPDQEYQRTINQLAQGGFFD